jgi:ribokinase
MNQAKTLKTELNSLERFNPSLPENYKKAKFLYLGNTDPEIQLKILNQMTNRPFVMIDTMNFWITAKRDQLEQVIKKVNMVVVNEEEARQFCQTPNLILAGKKILELGPEFVAIKKGEHGSLLFSHRNFFSAPGYPMEDLIDPTGAGDSFAGGTIGYLAKTNDITEKNIRRAIVYGSVIASFCAESFSLRYRHKIKINDIEERYGVFKKIRRF